MKVRIVRRPTGYFSDNGAPLREWPRVGQEIDLSEALARGLVASGDAEAVAAPAPKVAEPKVEKRPAPTAKVETRATPKAKQAD